LYQTNKVNPLAGCLPTLVTIPVFIGLYRALSNVADEGLLTEGFFWIPSLAGPTKLNGGLGWLNPGSDDFLGWAQTIAYLVMPVLLVISQSLSTKVLSPAQQSTDPSQQQTQAILKFLPLMIGYFSLNVPSGLTLYWLTNNFVTTAQQLYLRRKFDAGNVASASASGGSSSAFTNSPMTEVDDRPSGKEMNARRSSKTIDIEATTVSTSAAPSSSSSNSRGSRGQKFRSIKAREAAAKASSQASSSNGSAAQGERESESNANGAVTSTDRPGGVPDVPPAKDNSSRGKGKK
jgi:YidC/Oxa1 family membrane protein insertase